MEFGKHIGKGIWAFADKALPAIYGVGIVFLVVRILPEKEYGAFVIIQSIVAIASALCYALALQPMTKFVAEKDRPVPFITVALITVIVYYAVISGLIWIFRREIAGFFDPSHEGNLVGLFGYIPLLFLTSAYRNFAISLFQARYRVERIFWLDAIYFVGVIVLILVSQYQGKFHTAADLLNLNVVTYTLSTLAAIVLTRKDMSVPLEIDRGAIREMWDFGKYTLGGNTLYIFFSQVDIFFISSIAGLVAVATYNAAKIVTKVFDTINQVISMFLLPYSSKLFAQKDIEQLRTVGEKTICFSTILMLPVFLVTFIFPHEFLQIIYPGRYTDAATPLRLLGFLGLMVPWNVVLAIYLTTSGHVRKAFFIGVANFAISVVCLAGGTYLWGINGTSLGYIVSFAIYTLLLKIAVQKLVPLDMTRIASRTADIWFFIRSRLGLAS
jgi:O-antigen/teichoic acid export membrane protein